MILTKELLSELQNRLKVGNRRGVHLNAIPGNSRYKFDITRLSKIDPEIPKNFLEQLLSNAKLNFKISWINNVPDLNKLSEEEQVQLSRTTKTFENLVNQTDAIESEKGINTFGFGFPLLIRRDELDNKLTVAPLLIWSLRVKRMKEFNTWSILRNEDDAIYFNEVLINHIQSDSKITLSPLSNELLDDGLLSKEELINKCIDTIRSVNSSPPEGLAETLREKINHINPIKDKKYFESLPLNSTNAFIYFGGLFSIFEVQKQNIIGDYSDLMKLEGTSLELDDLSDHHFQSISSVETDPSQQSLLHALESKRNILIQGPPGTGKSQSLSAILVNALENGKKTLVVCEKRTALEVLEKSLNEKGLGSNCVLIKDIVKDRRKVVDSVRERIDDSSYKRYRYAFSRDYLEELIEGSKESINYLNEGYQKKSEPIIGQNNWTETVGMYLSSIKTVNEDSKLSIDKTIFSFEQNEFNSLKSVIEQGKKLYHQYKDFESYSYLNPKVFDNENPYALEQTINTEFDFYKKSFEDENSRINQILDEENNNPDFFNEEKTNQFWYKLLSNFSSKKKQTLNNQVEIKSLLSDLTDRMMSKNLSALKFDKSTLNSLTYSIAKILDQRKYAESANQNFFIEEYNWFKFYSKLNNQQKQVIDSLKPFTNWLNVFSSFYLNEILTNKASSRLITTEDHHDKLKENLSDFGREQIKFINNYWYSNQIDATRKFHVHNQNLSVENLYNKRSSHKHKRLSLRQIIKQNTDLFSSFFPVILTTPDVCSNLFKGLNQYFDIVLFDEASQLKLEDNLPALLKGKQIVIAGDEHQMPPSNYFSKNLESGIEDSDDFDEIEEEEYNQDDFILSCESLLEFAGELKFEKRYLDFHYRSQHPHLIDFSNYAFYNKRLRPLPNKEEYVPIKYLQVDGTYSDHCNEKEADKILDILEHDIVKGSNGEYPTVGIATFNISQRNLIKSKLAERQRYSKYEAFNEKIAQLEESGLFVKNLENIQGDERDIIILSTTYGKSTDGKFAQRFGPLNHSKGYKLLNVIVTRAKSKVFVCTSVPEDVFLNYNEHLITEGNNKRGSFFAYLSYAKAVSEEDQDARMTILNNLASQSSEPTNIDIYESRLESPFEEEVFHALKEKLGANNLIPQFEFGGFRIDIVYKTASNDLPDIAIECDGAMYHSSREAYLYDIHRQKILERNGFVFHRIWSTNWWRNPDKETEKLIRFIQEKDRSLQTQL